MTNPMTPPTADMGKPEDIAKLARYAIDDGIKNGAVRWRAALEVIHQEGS